jgi:Peptidase family M28
VIDLRIWRAALLAVPVVLVIAMFSLEDVPQPLQPGLPPDAFDSDAATQLAKELGRANPEPRPGSDADAALADVVKSRFEAITGVELSEQTFTTEFGGEDVELRNLIAVVPGQSERQIALIAHRDVAEGTGAATSVASTAALLEIASGFIGSTHEKTLVFVSTDGGSVGADGARRFVRDYTDRDLLDAAIVLSQPAAQEPSPPLVIPWSTGPESTGIALAETANSITSEQADVPAGDETPLDDLFRLAIPAAIGEQGPLVDQKLDAVRLSSSGELPPDPGSEEVTDISGESIDRFGRATLSLLLALDVAPSPLEHGPDAYVGLAGNLLPGWTLALLALALLLAVAAPAVVGVAAAARSPGEAARAFGWVVLRAVPFAFGLAAVWLFALVGVIPGPEFPFLPSAESLGTGGTIGVVAAALAAGAAAFLLRPLLPPSGSTAGPAPAAALSLAALAGLGVWLVNPYLALLVALGLQLWVLAAAGVGPGRLRTAGLVLAGMLPLLAAWVDLAGRFDAGPGVVWDLLFMLTGGQIGYSLALLGCLLLGAGLAIVAVNGPGPAPDAPKMKLRALVARGQLLEERRAARRERSSRRKRRRERKRNRRARPAREEQPERAAEPDAAEPEAPPESEVGPQPEEPEPARDPRMWSKPSRSILRPS